MPPESLTRRRPSRGRRLPRAEGLGLRLRTLAHAGELDARLAHGADPHDSPTLARHARLINQPGQRRRIALTFERLLAAAEHPPAPTEASAPLRRRELLERRDMIEHLITDLRELESPGVRGVAVARQLLREGAGPLHNPRGGDLAAELRRAVLMLESGRPAT